MENKNLIENIKNKKISITSFDNSIYSNLWYVDDENKICITFTPRGGCSISFQQYLHLIGLLDDGLNYNNFIHCYRCDIFNKVVKYKNIDELIDDKYIFIKFIMNPFIRAVSIFRAQTSHNLTFREYLKQLNQNKIDYFNNNDKYHLEQQYIDGEEKIITKYIKINENETYSLILSNNTEYIFDVNKFTSVHHGIKNKQNNKFCGDLQLSDIYNNLPSSYKYFYDEEIKILVYNYYKDDIEKYNFKFEDI